MIDLLLEAIVAACAAGGVFSVIRWRPGRPAVLLLGLAIVAGIYVGNPVHRVYSFHGFWHHAITYEILNGRFPPHEPLAAGQKLFYPWGIHLVAAAISAILRVTPATSFALMNVTCLAITLSLLWRIARTLGFDRTTSVFAATVPVFGITPFNVGHFAMLVQPLVPVVMDFRGTPPMSAFTNVTGGTFGILFFVLALDSVLGVFTAAESVSTRSRSVLLGGSMAGAAFFYPLDFVGAAGAVAVCIAVSALRGADRLRVVGASAAVLIGILATLPYLLSIGAGRDPAAALRIESDWESVLGDVGRYAITALAIVALTIWQRDRFTRFVREQGVGVLLIAAAAATTAALYVVAYYPQHAEYKLLTLSSICLGILVSPVLASIHDRHRAASFVIVAALFLPLGADVLLKVHPKWWNITDPYVERGTAIEDADPAERAVGRWIRAHTSPEDAFLDSRMTIPVFAERPLFLGTDLRRAKIRGWRPNGWLADPRRILHELEGLPRSLIDSRGDLVKSLLVDGHTPSDAALASAQTRLEGDLYVIAREPPVSERLAGDPRFEIVFTNSAASVYRLRPGTAERAS